MSAEITAASVKALREMTGLPMMECKAALTACGGDKDAAVEWLRKQGKKTQETRVGRDTAAGRIAVFADVAKRVGAIIEMRCESAPVSGSPEFIAYAQDLARQLATGPGAASPDALLSQPSGVAPGKSLGEVKDDMFNRIREVFKLERILRIDAPCGGYAHHDGSVGCLVEVEGGTTDAAKEIAMHVVAMRPEVVRKEDVDPDAVAKERAVQTEVARAEGKPENIIAKMIEGRLKDFFARRALLEQPFVKDDSKTVAKMAQESGMKVVRFERWEISK